jgi:hypothetical protein
MTVPPAAALKSIASLGDGSGGATQLLPNVEGSDGSPAAGLALLLMTLQSSDDGTEAAAAVGNGGGAGQKRQQWLSTYTELLACGVELLHEALELSQEDGDAVRGVAASTHTLWRVCVRSRGVSASLLWPVEASGGRGKHRGESGSTAPTRGEALAVMESLLRGSLREGLANLQACMAPPEPTLLHAHGGGGGGVGGAVTAGRYTQPRWRQVAVYWRYMELASLVVRPPRGG